jgi:hypothetical protein
VRDERVDYDLIGTRYRLQLFNYLAKMAMVDPAQLARDEQLAFYINLYNAAMIHEVIQRRAADPTWTPAANDFAVFKDAVVPLNGQMVSLNHLENDIIRPTFNDPRIHVALVCGAVSCPPLLPRAYRADDLNETLDRNMRRFVRDRTRNPIDDAAKQLRVSRIFDWYAGDFGGKDGVVAYISKYAQTDYSDYTVSFVEYSWDLNEVSPSK